MRQRAVTAAALLFCGGCVRFNYQRISSGEPVHPHLLSRLQTEGTTLGDCLRTLGAPTIVFSSDGDSTTTLAWTWLNELGVSVRASYPFAEVRAASPNFTFEGNVADMKGVIAIFDRDWQLVTIRQGHLSDPVNSDVVGALGMFRR